MAEKIYHKRGMKPKRKVIVSVEGRIYPEHVDTIMKLYNSDGLTIADITRLYNANERSIGATVKRLWRKPDHPYLERCKKYGKALALLDADKERNIADIADEVGVERDVVRKIARRNDLWRK